MTRFTHTFHYFFMATVLLFFTVGCADDLRQELQKDDALDKTVHIALSLPGMSVKTRSSLSEEDENTVHNAFLMVFNADNGDKIVSNAYDFTGNELEQDIAIRRKLGVVGLQANATYRFAVVVNYTDPGKFENSRYALTRADLERIATWDDLTALEIQYKAGKESRTRNVADLVMSGSKEQLIENKTKEVEIPIRRIDAKVTFKFTTVSNATFTPRQYKVMRMAKKTSLIEKADYQASTTSGDYFDDAEFSTEFESDDSFTFYTLENLSAMKQPIPSTLTDKEQERQRAKQQKNPISPTPGDKPTHTNGAFVNAPDNGTYLIVEGDFEKKETSGSNERYASTRYMIHLGHIGDDASGLSPANDYAVRRNTHYTYNIVVADVDHIITEAKATDISVEPDPRHEGFAFEVERSFRFDAHYEVANVTFNKSDFFNTDGTPKNVTFHVKTPFENASGSAAHDVNWVQFVRHDNPKLQAREFMSYTTTRLNEGNRGKLFFTAGEIIQKIHNKEKNFTFDKNDKLLFTIFIDENYYEKHPVTGVADATLWKQFVNTPDRILWMVNAPKGKEEVSPDGNSSYAKSFFSVRQRSIQTFYDTGNPNLQRAWGTESVEDYQGNIWQGRLLYFTGLPTDTRTIAGPNNAQNWSYTNGRYNTMREWGSVVSSFAPVDYDILLYKEGASGGYKWWHEVIDSRSNVLKYHPRGRDLYLTARYGCLLRNRDTNGNGKIDAHEVRWYLPAISQLVDMWVYRDALSKEARLNSPSVNHPRQPYHSSTAHYQLGSTQSNNNYVLLSESASSYNLREEIRSGGGGYYPSGSGESFRARYRCVRNLGIPTDEHEPIYPKVDGGPRGKNKITLPAPEPVYTYDQATRTFTLTNAMPSTYRRKQDIVENHELPLHHHYSSTNKPYKKFQVAKVWVDKGSIPPFYDKVYKAYKKNGSKCRTYSEKPDKSDRGSWRLPNERELSIIHNLSFYDATDTDYDNLLERSIISCTYNVFDKSNIPGLFIYKTGAAYNRMSVNGLPLYYPSRSWQLCVRDVAY